MSTFRVMGFRFWELYDGFVVLYVGALITGCMLAFNLVVGCIIGYIWLVLVSAVMSRDNQSLFSYTSNYTLRRMMVLFSPLTIALGVIMAGGRLLIRLVFLPYFELREAQRQGRKINPESWTIAGMLYYALSITVTIVIYILIT